MILQSCLPPKMPRESLCRVSDYWGCTDTDTSRGNSCLLRLCCDKIKNKKTTHNPTVLWFKPCLPHRCLLRWLRCLFCVYGCLWRSLRAVFSAHIGTEMKVSIIKGKDSNILSGKLAESGRLGSFITQRGSQNSFLKSIHWPSLDWKKVIGFPLVTQFS